MIIVYNINQFKIESVTEAAYLDFVHMMDLSGYHPLDRTHSDVDLDCLPSSIGRSKSRALWVGEVHVCSCYVGTESFSCCDSDLIFPYAFAKASKASLDGCC